MALLLDETYIHRIFMNLLSNAFKFMTSGYVLLTMEYNGNDLVAQVKDTGIAIPHVFLPRLFEPFSQAATQGSQRGTGLGLSIIKELLHKMDGNVTVQSRYAEGSKSYVRTGTTFAVTIRAQSPPTRHNLPEKSTETGTVAVFPRNCPISQEGQKAAWSTSVTKRSI
jgi:signal transduction histidine kinase